MSTVLHRTSQDHLRDQDSLSVGSGDHRVEEHFVQVNYLVLCSFCLTRQVSEWEPVLGHIDIEF